MCHTRFWYHVDKNIIKPKADTRDNRDSSTDLQTQVNGADMRQPRFVRSTQSNSNYRCCSIPITISDSDEFHSLKFAMIIFQTKQQLFGMCDYLNMFFLHH